jgi:hypothetical protein
MPRRSPKASAARTRRKRAPAVRLPEDPGFPVTTEEICRRSLTGLNLQPESCHCSQPDQRRRHQPAPFVRLVADGAYRRGSAYVDGFGGPLGPRMPGAPWRVLKEYPAATQRAGSTLRPVTQPPQLTTRPACEDRSRACRRLLTPIRTRARSWLT